MRLIARYAARDELAKDVREQLGRGGLLVKMEVPAGLEAFTAVELEVVCGGSVVVPAEVLQVFPGLGVAVSVGVEAKAGIEGLVAGTATASATATANATETASATETATAAATARAGTTGVNPAGAANMQKINEALRGTRDERMAVLRSPQRNLHVYVLRNPNVTIDEISNIARMTTVSVEVLKQIAERREWGHRPEIAIALVRNPTVPPQVAIGLLDHVSPAELRQLAKDTRTREAIQKAARRKVVGP